MTIRFLTTLAVVTGLIFASGAPAQSAPPVTPTSAKGVEVVTIDQAKALIGKAAFFDMRSPINFGKGHVKGATALPYDQKSELKEDFDASKDKFDMSKLPADKNAVMVFYSDGPTGWKSYKAAVTAAKQGYKNVKWMREGSDGWKAKGLPLE